MRDNEIAALVNELRDVAVKFHDHESLRNRISNLVVPAIKVTQGYVYGMELVTYQRRMRPMWVPEGTGWHPWENCSLDAYLDTVKTPVLHDWQWEVRALYTPKQ